MSEGDEQKEIIRWFGEIYPNHVRCIRVSLAGINFGSGARAGRMKNYVRSQGVQEGESDILIACPRGEFGSLILEHKAYDGKHPASDEQIDYIQFHNSIGNCATVTKGIDMAKIAITQYMSLGAPDYKA